MAIGLRFDPLPTVLSFRINSTSQDSVLYFGSQTGASQRASFPEMLGVVVARPIFVARRNNHAREDSMIHAIQHFGYQFFGGE